MTMKMMAKTTAKRNTKTKKEKEKTERKGRKEKTERNMRREKVKKMTNMRNTTRVTRKAMRKNQKKIKVRYWLIVN